MVPLNGVLGSTPASGVGGGASPPPELVTSYAYNPTDGRLETIRGGGLHPPSQFNYSYLANSNLIKTITSPAHTVTNTYEPNRNILDVKENKAGTTIISKHDYLVNAIGQRSNLAQTGTAFATVFAAARDVAWGYDPLGQVTSADSTIPGHDRAYQYDLIGNRQSGGDLGSPISYTANALNQYSAIGSINPSYDDDGNAEDYPLPANVNANSALIWDGENRLIEAQVTGGATVSYVYDSQSRRIAETVGSNTKITVYDSWNPIAEYGRAGLQPASLAKTYTWGIDLSGSMQGAGGVGGLLMVTVGAAGSVDRYYPTFDGNGNVSEYLNSTGTTVAHYEYDPFGKTTVATGPKANDFTHRFSTKPLDAATGLYYYGYRFYDPNSGRWPSRDPIAEMGGVNLYGFVGNAPTDYIDILGEIIWRNPFNDQYYEDFNKIPRAKIVKILRALPVEDNDIINAIAKAAHDSIGVSTAEIEGTENGNLGCAAAVSIIFYEATGEKIVPGAGKIVLGTGTLYSSLSKDPRFETFDLREAAPGDIVVTARAKRAGHTGVIVENYEIISNSSGGFRGSKPGTIQKNYSIDKWQEDVTPRNPKQTKAFRYIGKIKK